MEPGLQSPLPCSIPACKNQSARAPGIQREPFHNLIRISLKVKGNVYFFHGEFIQGRGGKRFERKIHCPKAACSVQEGCNLEATIHNSQAVSDAQFPVLLCG